MIFGTKNKPKDFAASFFFEGKLGSQIFCFEKFLENPHRKKKKTTKVRYVQEQSKKTIHAVFRGIGPFGPMGCSQLAPASPGPQQRSKNSLGSFQSKKSCSVGATNRVYKGPLFVGVLGCFTHVFSAIYRRHMENTVYNDGDRAHLVGAHLKFSSLELENEALRR